MKILGLKKINAKTLYSAVALMCTTPFVMNAQATKNNTEGDALTCKTSSELSMSYGKANILGKNCFVPMLQYEIESYDSKNTYFKPKIAASGQYVEVSMPVGNYYNINNWTFEGGWDVFDVKHVYNPSNFNDYNDEEKTKKGENLGEISTDLCAGIKYQNEKIGIGLKGSYGLRTFYHSYAEENTEENRRLEDELFTEVKATFKYAPFQKSKIFFNAEGIYDTQKNFQFNAGIGYKFK